MYFNIILAFCLAIGLVLAMLAAIKRMQSHRGLVAGDMPGFLPLKNGKPNSHEYKPEGGAS